MRVLHNATMPLLGAMAPTDGMWWWWRSDTSWVSHTSWVARAEQDSEGKQPIEVAPETVPDILSTAPPVQAVCGSPGKTEVWQPVDAGHIANASVTAPMVALARHHFEPTVMRPRRPSVLTVAHCSSFVHKRLRINAMEATAGDVRMQHTQGDPGVRLATTDQTCSDKTSPAKT